MTKFCCSINLELLHQFSACEIIIEGPHKRMGQRRDADHIELPRGTCRQAPIGRSDLLQADPGDLTGQH